MTNITITKNQLKKLEGLAYWIANLHYIRERFGVDEPETETCRKTINLIFDELDEKKTSFVVQNMVICWAENWRNYKSQYTRDFLQGRGVTIL